MTDSSSRHAHTLGAAGVLPFIALAAALWLLPTGYTATTLRWLLAYGAVILSFVGALHWGVALVHPEIPDDARARLMVWSVMPALAGWLALAVTPIVGLGLLTAMFVLQFVADQRLAARFPLSPWFLRLRGRLTAAVVLCLALALASLLMR